MRRLNRNKERRQAREKGKKPGRQSTVEPKEENTGSPAPIPTVEKPTGTARKCANCGQVGHIKTNKKYCPNCE